MFLLHVRRVMLLECTVGGWDGRTVNLGLDAIKRGSGENLMKDQTRGNIACDALPVFGQSLLNSVARDLCFSRPAVAQCLHPPTHPISSKMEALNSCLFQA